MGDQPRSKKYTHEPRTQESEEAALVHMWRVMGYGDTPGLPSYERHPDHPVTTSTEPIVPTLVLTEPTPSSSQQASVTPQKTTSQAMASAASQKDVCSVIHQRLMETYQCDLPTPTSHAQYSKLSPTQFFDPPLRIVPRPAGDYQNMLQAMATGNFDIPIFGAAGAAFQNRFAAQTAPTPSSTAHVNASPNLHQQRTWTHVSGTPPIPNTPTPQPKKRKRAQISHDTDSQEAERAPKKPTEKKKKKVVRFENPA